MNEYLLLSPSTVVVCPQCENSFSLEQGFARQALETIEASSASALADLKQAERAAVERRAQQLAGEREKNAQQEAEDLRKLLREQSATHVTAIAEMKALTENAFQPQLKALQERLAESHGKLTAMDGREAALATREQSLETRVAEAAKKQALELFAADKASFEQQLCDKDSQVAELRAQEVTLRVQKAAVEDRAAALEVEVARKLDSGRAEIEAKVRAQEQERSSLREAEYQKTISDMNGKLMEAQRKAEQGSQQLQGEVLELAIEDGLRRTFPFDIIEEVKKGVRGGDIVQRVSTRAGQVAGVLLWETKRAKDWSPQWIVKLKDDMRSCAAEVGVLVTMPTAVPKEWHAGQVFGLIDEVWVTTWSPAMQLAEVLRCGLLDVHKQRLVSSGKGEKMEAVYDYLTSPHFAHKLRAVYDTFQKMREELESEKNQATQRWARREKQLQSGVTCLLGIGGEIQGLAQQELPELELDLYKLT